MLPNVNETFAEFAAHFTGERSDPDGDILFPEMLQRPRLDYTLDSLHVVDDYCVRLHQVRDQLRGPGVSRSVIWGGAYVGEVIRRNAQITFSWVDYDDYVAADPRVKSIVGPRDVPTYAFLCKPNRAMNLPLSKFLKCISNGIEDSVHFHASAELAGQFR